MPNVTTRIESRAIFVLFQESVGFWMQVILFTLVRQSLLPACECWWCMKKRRCEVIVHFIFPSDSLAHIHIASPSFRFFPFYFALCGERFQLTLLTQRKHFLFLSLNDLDLFVSNDNNLYTPCKNMTIYEFDQIDELRYFSFPLSLSLVHV